MAKRFLIETFGCQMNVHDSERMAGLLVEAGYEATVAEDEADLIVINTCSVREHAEEKLYSRLGELRVLQEETGRRPVVTVAGCVAQQEGDALRSKTNGQIIDVVLGTQRLKMLPMLVNRATTHSMQTDIRAWDDVTFPLGITRRTDAVKAYVTIVEGCNDHCAFCVVPYTRGHERMRSKSEIMAEAREAVASGHKEICLLGQIVNHYQAPDDASCDFPQLLSELNEIGGVERIRFASPHPRHTSTRLIEAVRDLDRVCKHLHLPVQSGSTSVLRSMRRRYTREEYLDLLFRIREAIPGVALSTDVIVGFPGESAADFEQTLSLVSGAEYHSLFSFKYSVRPNTLAAKRMPDNVTEEEKTARIVELQSLQRGVQWRLHTGAVGTTVSVLVDSISRRRQTEISGRTVGNTVVNFPVPTDIPDSGLHSWMGRTVPVLITRAGPYSLSGEVVTARTPGLREGHGHAD